MPLPFNELLKEARIASRYPHPHDFARAIGRSIGGYAKWEFGTRIPSYRVMDEMLKSGLLPEKTGRELIIAWRKAKADKAGIPTPAGDIV